MDLQDLGAIGDLVGGVGVIVSLIYVAHQIRQNSVQIEHNSRHVEAAMYQQTADAFSRWQALVAQDAALTAIWARGVTGQVLDPLERARFGMLVGILLNAYENSYYQREFGALQRDTLGISRGLLASLLASPEGAAWWKSFAPSILTAEFRTAVEKLAGNVGDASGAGGGEVPPAAG
jgi:hypothetical protein